MRLREPIEKSGFFWPPGREDERVPGVLHISRSGAATLEVTVLVRPEQAARSVHVPWRPSTEPATPHRIVGIVGGSYVTLEKCYHLTQKVHFGGVSESRLAVEQAFLGAHYDEDEPIAFSTVLFSLKGLNAWPSVSNIRTEPDEDDGAFTAYIGPPKRLSLRLPGDVDLLLVTYNDSVREFFPPGLRVVQRTQVELRTPSPRPVSELTALVARLQRFFSLALDRTLPLESIKGLSEQVTGEAPSGEADGVSVEMYYGDHPRQLGERRPDGYLVRYREFARQPHRFLEAWLRNYERYEPAFDVYFDVAFGSASTAETRFLKLTTALEVLHGRTYSGRRNTRLFDRILKMAKPFGDLLGRRRHERNEFACIVWHTRNNLLHHEPQRWIKAASGGELWISPGSSRHSASCACCNAPECPTRRSSIPQRAVMPSSVS